MTFGVCTERQSSRGGSRAALGFTLLETLVALAILGLGVTAALQLMGASARSAAHTQVVTGALLAAEELVEEAASLDESEMRDRRREAGEFQGGNLPGRSRLAALGAGALGGIGGRDAAAQRYSYERRIAADPADRRLFLIDVEIAWGEPDRGRVRLTTFRRVSSPDVLEDGEQDFDDEIDEHIGEGHAPDDD